MKKLNVAVIGQGRSGRDIHGLYYIDPKNVYYNVKYVIEMDEVRGNEALTRYPGCEVLKSYQELFDKTDVDIVVNASYNYMHYPITKDLLMHKFNVLVEKPFSRNRYECEDLIKTAEEQGVILAVFQQSFYAPYYLEAKKLIDSGKLGKIEHIEIRFNGFSRRWDWQTLLCKMGGNAYNTGPHPIGLAYGFLDFDEDSKVVYSTLQNTAHYSGDGEDYFKMILTAPDKPIVDVEVSCQDAFCDYNIKVCGSLGTYKTSIDNYDLKYMKDPNAPMPEVIFDTLRNENGMPMYCTETLEYVTESGKHPGGPFDIGTPSFYEDLYYKLTENREMFVRPEHAKMVIGAIEELHANNPLPLKY